MDILYIWIQSRISISIFSGFVLIDILLRFVVYLCSFITEPTSFVGMPQLLVYFLESSYNWKNLCYHFRSFRGLISGVMDISLISSCLQGWLWIKPCWSKQFCLFFLIFWGWEAVVSFSLTCPWICRLSLFPFIFTCKPRHFISALSSF